MYKDFARNDFPLSLAGKCIIIQIDTTLSEDYRDSLSSKDTNKQKILTEFRGNAENYLKRILIFKGLNESNETHNEISLTGFLWNYFFVN
jgi:hypothetical protein